MKRRSFGKILATLGIVSSLKRSWAGELSHKENRVLPDITKNGNAVETCINSRFSTHGGYSSQLDPTVAANVLWAAASAPLIASKRTIYAALDDNLYTSTLQSGKPVLELHLSGDKRVDSSSAFQVGISTTPPSAAEDAGVALHWAQLASVAFWKNTANQPASLPSEAACGSAKLSWKTESALHLVTCFGRGKTGAELKKECVALSSDNSLPSPNCDGTMSLEDAMQAPLFGDDFTSDDLSKEEVSQILWASYGSTPHTVIGGNNAANAVATHTAGYFLQAKIYLVSSGGVQRYHIRKTATDKTSRDHRLELLGSSDVRVELRASIERLPQNAPLYIVYCGSKVEAKQLMEAGFAGAGALLQATALGVQGHYRAQFTADEQKSIQAACGIVAADIPLLIFSAGYAGGTSVKSAGMGQTRQSIDFTVASVSGKYIFTITAPAYGKGHIDIYTPSGKRVLRLHVDGIVGKKRTIVWDGTDASGRTVAAGSYTCVLTTSGQTRTIALKRV